MPVVGIDLGTTNSAIAVFTAEGPKLIVNALGEKLTPSCVGVDDDGTVLVGRAARERLVTHPDRTVASFKRLMGTTRETRLARGKVFRPEELSALVLASLRADAEAELGESIGEAVISVPAYFNDVQRKATLDAARLAGLKVERLVNEPTAAALAYGLESRKDGLFLVFDLGGGTFDVSLLEAYEGVMEVRATAGDTFLGGDDFTRALAEAMAADLGIEVAELPRHDLARLFRAAEGLKRSLSGAHEASYEVRLGESVRSGPFGRGRFEEIAAPLVNRLKAPLERAINDSGRRFHDIDAIVLVGGATRMPVVRGLVARLFGQFPLIQVDPDLTVALGAAVQAGLKARDAALDDVVLTDVAPFTLGTAVTKFYGMRDQIEVAYPIIERNSAVPVSRAQKFFTLADNQDRIAIGVYQGESVRPENNLELGRLEVAVPRGTAGREGVEARFTYDVNGALEVEVTSLSTGVKERKIFRNASNLTEKELEERFAALAAIKIAPRDQAENRALLARAERLYEEMLGDARDELRNRIAEFERAIQETHRAVVQEQRERFGQFLDRLEAVGFRLE